MKRNYMFLLLLVPVLALSVLYLYLTKNEPFKSDLYKIAPGAHLFKKDYFSEYQVIITDNEAKSFVTNIDKLFVSDYGCVVKYRDSSGIKILYMSSEQSEPVIVDKLDELSGMINIDQIKMKNPWQVTESLTLANKNRLIHLIILISITILSSLIIMKVFNIKRL